MALTFRDANRSGALSVLLLVAVASAWVEAVRMKTRQAADEEGRRTGGMDVKADHLPGIHPGLAQEIADWKKGDPPPPRLLQFPDGPPLLPPRCGMRAFGGAVEDYLSRITDDDLLKALLFDPQADNRCVRAATRRLLETRGVQNLRAVLAERRRSHPEQFGNSELATITQLVTAPYARIRVASVEKRDVPRDQAEKALAVLEADLSSGVPWDRAYRKAADMLFDRERSQQEAGGWRTFLCYRYDGLITPVGFDLLDRRISDHLAPDHVRQLFEAKKGTLQLETAARYWLYFIEAFFE